jgi:DNA-binding transcriptional regulator YhcF (GntR family)
MLNEEVIDVVSEEVVEEEVVEQPQFAETYVDAYKQYKHTKYKLKQLREQVQNNIKAQRGFGYTYKEISYDS